MNDVLAVILAGGKGSRLEPLTRERAKPAVPFGGNYRIIDFALSNCINSGLRRILLLTQYKAMSLDRHINLGWRQFFCRELDESLDILPPQQRIDENWYRGTADAVYQNIYALERANPRYVVILAGDHIYKMNYREMVDHHVANRADLTIGALTVGVQQARQFGVMEADANHRVIGFEEKPQNPRPIPGSRSQCLASMGIYVFSTPFLLEQLCRDAIRGDSSHDFGKDIIPSVIRRDRVFAFPFKDENKKSQAYWRDVGTLDAYYMANMDLIDVEPMLNIYDEAWPIRTYQRNLPPAKFVFGSGHSEADLASMQRSGERVGHAIDSIACHGTIVSGGSVQRSILGCSVRVNSFANVTDSILFDGVEVGRHAKVHRAIIEKGVSIPPHAKIGIDAQKDFEQGLTITESGIVVVSKEALNRKESLSFAMSKAANAARLESGREHEHQNTDLKRQPKMLKPRPEGQSAESDSVDFRR